jgi:iron complex transport system ATP-binding protein
MAARLTLMPPVLHLQNVNVMRGEQVVLHDLNLRIDSGEHIALLGPNGCGKSTLLKTITRELYPLVQPGTKVEIFGKERWDLVELRQRLGIVQSDLPGQPILRTTGREAILTGFFSSSTLWPNLVVTRDMHERADRVLEQTAATHLSDKIFGEMSAGQQRRILIGRALAASGAAAGNQATLLLDEPSNALDLAAQRDLRDLMSSLAQRGTTIILITHQIADIIPEMQRILLMREGRIAADGSRTRLLTAETLSALFGTPVHLTEIVGRYHAW